jgi:hypothetical protein
MNDRASAGLVSALISLIAVESPNVSKGVRTTPKALSASK